MTSLAGARPPMAAVAGATGLLALFIDQLRYALRELWRSRLVLIFTFVLPLAWLLIIGLMAGNDAIDPVSGIRVMQFVTPAVVVMGVLFATYPQVAYSLATAREMKIVKRISGTPLPAWLFLAGRVGAATVLALLAIVVMLGVAVVGYDVQILGRTLPALIVTLIVGTASFSALGLAVGSVASSGSSAQTFSVASGMILLFISGLFFVGSKPPEILVTIGSLFPVSHVLSSLQAQLNPYFAGDGWDFGGLAIVAGWGVAGLGAAAWALRREPVTRAGRARAPVAHDGSVALKSLFAGRTSALASITDQVRWANSSALRNPSTLFFAIAMPAGLYALMSVMYANTVPQINGLPFAMFFATGMSVYGIAVSAFLNTPTDVARARDRLVLKRLRGTPTAGWQYLTGRTVSAVWIGLLTAVLVFGIGMAFFDVQIGWGGLPLALGVFLLGTLTLAACGYALGALTPNARAMAFSALGILLPLSFFSDVFVLGNDMPAWMTTVGSVFPLRPFVHALADALAPSGPTLDPLNLVVLAVWLMGASVVALRRFRWEPPR